MLGGDLSSPFLFICFVKWRLILKMTIVQSIIIAIVEGITEFIPISSTGHMIIAEKLLNLADDGFNTVFTVAIQLGAILSVVVLYRKKFLDFTRLIQIIQFYTEFLILIKLDSRSTQ